MLNLRPRTAARKAAVRTLYDALVARARAPAFYRDFAVADTIDGRFDMMALHGWLVLAWLKQAGRDDEAQGLTDAIFTGFDAALREQGAGDMGLGRRIKAMADAFFGRLKAYEEASDQDAMAQALARNLYRGGAAADARAQVLAAYVFAARGHLAQSGPDRLDFGPLPLI